MTEAVGTLVESPVTWAGDRYVYGADRFKPWEGYWVKNTDEQAVALGIPPREVAGSASSPGRTVIAAVPVIRDPGNGWAVAIGASSMGALDTHNEVGVQPGASTARDRFDRSEAPMSPGRAISLYFPHPSWEDHPGDYTVDIRGQYEELGALNLTPLDTDLWGHVWRFDVAKNFSDGTGGDEVVLEFTGIENVPSEAEIVLVDRTMKRVIDIRRRNRYAFFQSTRDFVGSERETRFVLVVGSESFLELNKDEFPRLPANNALHQNFPNPFNPSTVIRYDLSEPGRVQVRIFDVSGALVRVLVDMDQDPGRYEVGWNGENKFGQRAASGVYFYRLTLPGYTQTRKMILIK
jgi:hypothetical protein